MPRKLKIVIIGGGICGICAAVQLQKQLGIYDYTIFDENEEVGGTWLVNNYPGAACDVPSHFYSFSFHPNPNWTELFSSQQEILEYLKDVARSNDLYSKIKFNQLVTKCVWDEINCQWELQVKDKKNGEVQIEKFDIAILAVGGLRAPKIPKQFDSFKGPKFHSAQWNHGVSLEGKTVAVIGTGASAAQVVPGIVDKVGTLIVYQRNPPWVVPRPQFTIPQLWKWIFHKIPFVLLLFRFFIFWIFEFTRLFYIKGNIWGKKVQDLATNYINKSFMNRNEKDSFIPSYTFGCKRIVLSDNYYSALLKKNVIINRRKIKEVQGNCIVTDDGAMEQIDVLILATGFETTGYVAPMKIIGANGIDGNKLWHDKGPQMFLGIMSSEAPNLFAIFGTNSAFIYTSAIFCAECCTNWTMKVLAEMIRKESKFVKVDEQVVDKYMKRIMKNMEKTVWSGDCGAWFKDHRGIITGINPNSAITHWRLTRNVDLKKLHFK